MYLRLSTGGTYWRGKTRGVNRLLENLGLGCLGVSEIHHLVQQLVDDDEVVPDTLLLELLEVLRKYFDYPMQEQQYLRRI